ncbi:hypothetical protein HG530_011433 [Fusarium avenaceum]|nr:hypothetical protein HG530_011433 [Fusarium avenaceum]
MKNWLMLALGSGGSGCAYSAVLNFTCGLRGNSRPQSVPAGFPSAKRQRQMQEPSKREQLVRSRGRRRLWSDLAGASLGICACILAPGNLLGPVIYRLVKLANLVSLVIVDIAFIIDFEPSRQGFEIWLGVVVAHMASHLAIAFYTAEDGAVPAKDVAELVDIFAVEASGEFLM